VLEEKLIMLSPVANKKEGFGVIAFASSNFISTII
jgi:hypothetical protein